MFIRSCQILMNGWQSFFITIEELEVNVACVFYLSASVFTSKGVMIDHSTFNDTGGISASGDGNWRDGSIVIEDFKERLGVGLCVFSVHFECPCTSVIKAVGNECSLI